MTNDGAAMARTASPPEPRSGSDNLYATLAAGFPADRAACAIEALHPGSAPLYYSWQDIDHATGKLANLLASLRLSPGARYEVRGPARTAPAAPAAATDKAGTAAAAEKK